MTGRWQRARWPLAAVGLLVLVAVAAALTLPRGSGDPLDPQNAAPSGSRAVAQILQRQGVVVTRITKARELAARAVPDSTLLVTGLDLLPPELLREVRDSGADLVLVEPDAVALAQLAPAVTPAGVVGDGTGSPGCSAPDPTAAGEARAGGHLYSLAGGTGLQLCYRDAEDGTAGSYVTGTDSGHRLTVIGQAGILTNGLLSEQGNAALALRALGQRRSLVWYLPDPLDTSTVGEPPTLSQLRPRWVTWVAWQLLLAGAVAVLWRARRLGRLVSEPLPVVVRAAETQEGRARLYRASRSRGRAAATLRTASVRRLAARIDASTEATPIDVVRLVAAAVGRPESEVTGLLLGPAPTDDPALVWLADQLDALEHALADPARRAHPTRREVPAP